jgi:lysozyme
MRHITQTGLELIKSFESFSSRIYICPAGYQTIGYGHVVKESEREKFLAGIAIQEGEMLLRQDTQIAEQAVCRLITVPLTDGQFDALISFTFNLGSGALQRSTLRRKVNREEHDDVTAEFAKWVWGGGIKLNGLIYRRNIESKVYNS